MRPCSKWPVWKKLWNQEGSQEMAVMLYVDGKFLITTILVNLCCLIPGISTKFIWIVVIKIFAINVYHHSHFLAAPLISQLFSHCDHFEQGCTFLYSQAVFEQILLLFMIFLMILADVYELYQMWLNCLLTGSNWSIYWRSWM